MSLFELQPAAVGFFLLIAVYLAFFAHGAWRWLKTFGGDRNPATSVWLPTGEVKPSEAVAKAHSRLCEWGFTLIGLSENRLPRSKAPVHIWHYHCPETAVYVEVKDFANVKRPLFAVFVSLFDDESLLYTAFPYALTTQVLDRDFHLRFAAHSLTAAYTYHQYMLDRWRADRRVPVPIANEQDVSRLDSLYWSKFNRRAMQSTRRQAVVRLLAFTLLSVASFVIVILSFVPLNNDAARWGAMSVPFIVYLATGLGFFIQGALYRRQFQTYAIDAEYRQQLVPERGRTGSHPLEEDPTEVDI